MTRIVSATVSMTAALLLAGTSVASTAPSATASGAIRSVATGSFVASVDFSTLAAEPVGNRTCEFTVQGTLTFTGTLTGVASGTTTALIAAPCPEALSQPPGTFRDVFRFEGDFAGTVAGVPAEGNLTYAGVTRPGGSIDANLRLRADTATATLRTVDAELGRGGTYRGIAVSRS